MSDDNAMGYLTDFISKECNATLCGNPPGFDPHQLDGD
jgi:hypothetical protein